MKTVVGFMALRASQTAAFAFPRRIIASSMNPTGLFSNSITSNREYIQWATEAGVETNGKIEIRLDSRGYGAFAAGSMDAGELIATIPMNLLIMTDVSDGWVARLCQKVLQAVYSDDGCSLSPWLTSWRGGGFATRTGESDPWLALDPLDNDKFTLLATGSDNDMNIFAKFGLKCHPVIERAAIRLQAICGTSLAASRSAVEARGRAFRACRDNMLLPALRHRARDPKLEGSARDQNVAEAARYFSQCAARATPLTSLNCESVVIVPLFDLLNHGVESVKLVQLAVGDMGQTEPCVGLVAARALSDGEELTRDYSSTPLMNGFVAPTEETESAKRLRLLLQCGVKPAYADAAAGRK